MCSGHAKCLSIVNEVNSTLSLFIITAHSGLVGKQNIYYFMVKRVYDAPVVEVYLVTVERGFQNSLEDPDVAETKPW